MQAIRLGTGSFNPVWCACHTIQLSINDALKVKLGMVSINRGLDKCWDICRLVRRSEMQDEEGLPIYDVEDRFVSDEILDDEDVSDFATCI